SCCSYLFFFKQKTAYEFETLLELRRVLFRSSSASIPEPWSVTVSTPSVNRTVTDDPTGLYLTALSKRFVTARSKRLGSPTTSQGVNVRSILTSAARLRTRSQASATVSASSNGPGSRRR